MRRRAVIFKQMGHSRSMSGGKYTRFLLIDHFTSSLIKENGNLIFLKICQAPGDNNIERNISIAAEMCAEDDPLSVRIGDGFERFVLTAAHRQLEPALHKPMTEYWIICYERFCVDIVS